MDLGRIPQKIKMIAVLVAFLLVLSIFYIFVCHPKVKEVAKLRGEFQVANLKLQALISQYGSKDKLEEEIKSKQKEIFQSEAKIPEGQQVSQILHQLFQVAEESKVDSIFFKTSPSVKVKIPSDSTKFAYYKLPIEIQVQCSYRAFGKYLRGLEMLSSPISVDRLVMERNETIWPNLRIRLVIFAYVGGNIE